MIDLGSQPLVEFPEPGQVVPMRPLRAALCERCWLLQVPATAGSDRHVTDHGHGSLHSPSVRRHERRWAAGLVRDLGLDERHRVVDIAAGDGHILDVARRRSVPVEGFERDGSLAAAARRRGVRVHQTSEEELLAILGSGELRADLIVVNHALAHVDDLRGLLAGLASSLTADGLAAVEFHHGLAIIDGRQFDVICHAHRSYLTLTSLAVCLRAVGLTVVRSRLLALHGGSVRVLVGRSRRAQPAAGASDRIMAIERAAGVDRAETYRGLASHVREVQTSFVEFLDRLGREDRRRPVGYGAPGRAVTLLNLCGVTARQLPWIADRDAGKEGREIGGTGIPIVSPSRISRREADTVIILPWPLAGEIARQLEAFAAAGGRFGVAMPAPVLL